MPPEAVGHKPGDAARANAFETAGALPDLAERLARATGPLPPRLASTWWDSVGATFGGAPHVPGRGVLVETSLEDFAACLARAAQEYRPKSEARAFVHGASLWGGSTDAEAMRVAWTWADCDGRGDWTELLEALRAIGVAFVASRSGGHSPSKPKWHVHFPLARALLPPQCPAGADPGADPGTPAALAWGAHEVAVSAFKARFRDETLWWFGVLARLGGLRADAFDPKVADRVFQPCYPAARRTLDATPAEVVHFDGAALDWRAMLEATGYRPTPAAAPREHRELDPETAGAWVRAFAREGLHLREIAPDKHAVTCPWAFEHSAGGGDTGTVLLGGRFHCAHEHCRGRTNTEVRAVLSPAARAIVDGVAVKRARERLIEHAAVEREAVSLDEVGARVESILRAHKPGTVDVIAAPCGSGKNRGVNPEVPRAPHGAIVVAPTTILCTQHASDIRRPFKVQHRRGVLSHDPPKCAKHALAKSLQDAGASVPDVLCKTCPAARGCAALKASREDDGADIVVTVPQLAAGARAAIAKRLGVHASAVLMVVDEGVTLFDQVRLTPGQLADALAFLDADAKRLDPVREFEPVATESIRALLEALIRTDAGTLEPDPAALERATVWRRSSPVPLGRAMGLRCAVPEVKGGRSRAPTLEGLSPEARGAVATSRAAQEGTTSSPRPAKARTPRPAPLASRPDAAERLAPVLRVVAALDALLAAIEQAGAAAIEWHEGELNTRVMTDLAADIRSHGAVILDATPDENALRALHPAPRIHRLDVPDRVDVSRTVVFRHHASYRHLTPQRGADRAREVDWTEVEPMVREAIKRATDAGVSRLLVVCFKLVADGIKTGTNPEAIAVRKHLDASGMAWDFAHYGAVRGLNRWAGGAVASAAWFDGCATIGDPRPNLIDARADLRAVRALRGVATEPTAGETWDALRDAAERELEQAHGRLRDPSRTTEAHHWHLGTMVPTGWSVANGATVEEHAEPAGDATPEEIADLVERLGTVREAALIAGVSIGALSNYANGRRVAPARVVTALRDACGIRPSDSRFIGIESVRCA